MLYKTSAGLLLSAFILHGTAAFAQSNSNRLSNTLNSEKMKEYILIIRLPLSYGPTQAQAVRGQWTTLTDQWKTEGRFVTSFIAPTDGYVVTGKDKNVARKSIVSDDTKVISSIIIKATDMEQATELAQLCPILDQGGTVEVRETQPRPEATNKEIIRNLYENILNNRKMELLNDVIAPDYTGIGAVAGAAGFSATVLSVIAGFPDIKWTIEDIVSEGDKVIVRWHWSGTNTAPFRGIPASNKKVTDHAIVIYQLTDGKVSHAWLQGDRLGVLMQVGLIPEGLIPGSAPQED
jgi:predicted ester cyclase